MHTKASYRSTGRRDIFVTKGEVESSQSVGSQVILSCHMRGMSRGILIVAVLALLAGVVNSLRQPLAKASFVSSRYVSSSMSVREMAVLRQDMSLSAKSKGPTPVDPAPAPKGVETKYLVALAVFLGACVFDFFRMHGGVAPWQEGGFL